MSRSSGSFRSWPARRLVEHEERQSVNSVMQQSAPPRSTDIAALQTAFKARMQAAFAEAHGDLRPASQPQAPAGAPAIRTDAAAAKELPRATSDGSRRVRDASRQAFLNAKGIVR
jgi:hypothetical protein